jgi:chromosome partitioning protein
VKKFCDDMSVDPKLAGMVLSRIGRRALHRERTEASLREQFGNDVFTARLQDRVKVSEAVEKNTPIHIYDVGGPAAAEFNAMGEELLVRIGAKAKK